MHTLIVLQVFTAMHHMYLDEELNSAVGVSLNLRLNPDERFDLGIEPVRHELELSVWRDK